METLHIFTSYKVLTLVEKKTDIINNEIQEQLSVKNSDEKLSFFLNSEQGLSLDTGRKILKKNNVVGEFIKLEDYDLTALKNFIEKYGYFFKLSSSEQYKNVELKDIYRLKNRFKSLIHLLYALHNEELRDYKEVLNAIYLLLFTFQISNERKAKQFNIINLLFHFPKYEEFTSSYDRVIVKTNADGFESSFYRIDDFAMEDEVFEIAIQDYHDFIADSNNHHSLSRTLLKAFKNKHLIKQKEDRMIIDFLFHMWVDFEVIYVKDMLFEDILNAQVYEDFNNKASKKMKQLSLNIAKYLISKELNNALSGLVPSYDFEKLRPCWKIPNLYTALYFTIFNLDSSSSIIRKCDNVNCGDYFIVSKSNKKKRFCCEHCAKAVSQRNYSAKKKKNN
jgi:hypothetical protein